MNTLNLNFENKFCYHPFLKEGGSILRFPKAFGIGPGSVVRPG